MSIKIHSELSKFIEIVIVEDQNLFARGFRKILESIEYVEVIYTMESGKGIKEQLEFLKPDVLFLDLNLPGKNGLEILKSIRGAFPNMIIAILTMYEDQLLINKVRENNANAYLSKDASIEELKKVIYASPDDPFYVSKSIHDTKVENAEILADPFKDFAQITNRETEIIALIAKGKSTDQISEFLYISPETVKTHRKNIFRKLKLNSAPELVKFAYENNLV